MEKVEKEMTGYASIDKPSYQYYPENIEELILENTDQKMYDFIKESNKGFENNPIYSYFGEKMSFQDFDKLVELYAKSLKKYGLSKGDIITICLPNIPETVIYFYACNRIGVTPYLVDPRCTENRIKECMDISNSKLLIFLLDSMSNINPNNINADNIVVVSPGDFFNHINTKINNDANKVKQYYRLKESIYKLQTLFNNKVKFQQNFLKGLENYGNLIDSIYDPEIPAAIVNTSGTTGTAKGAMETNKGYNTIVNQISYVAPNIERGMSYFGYIPIFSLYGSSVGMHTAMSKGIVMDLVPKLDVSKFDEIYVNKKPNIVVGVPRLFEIFNNSKLINSTDLSFGKLLVMGGDKISPSKLDEINKTLKNNGCQEKIKYGFGSTETGMISTTLDDDEKYYSGSCGTLYPGVNVRITDRETLEEKKYNEEGEIFVNTPTLFKGYIGKDEETNKTIFVEPKTGIKYYRTEDRGYITKDGILYFTGRYKRLMKRPDGHQVSSVPIEDAISKNDLVKDVCVVGISNSYQTGGVIPTAFIELKDKEYSINTIKEIIKTELESVPGEREMALAYVIVDNIPYTSNGKVDYKSLENNHFENLEFVALDDVIINEYFLKGENISKINLKELTRKNKILKLQMN